MHKPADLPERLAVKVRIDLLTGCWLWIAYCDRDGYGRAYWQRGVTRAHIVVYRLLVGKVPDELELDHVRERGCRWRCCCNPAHLEPVTRRENLLRSPYTMPSISKANPRTRCPQGHSLADAIKKPDGSYHACRQCRREWEREYKRRQRTA
jgi:HNH endonuclease